MVVHSSYYQIEILVCQILQIKRGEMCEKKIKYNWLDMSLDVKMKISFHRLWERLIELEIYQELYLCTCTWMRVTTQISFRRLISRVAPNPLPARPELVTWLRAVSCANHWQRVSHWVFLCFTLENFFPALGTRWTGWSRSSDLRDP